MVHVKPKRPLAPVPFLQSSINEIIHASNERSLSAVLEKFESPYRFERPEERNLINWYKVLNRFDELLERYINERSIFDKSSTLDQGKHSSVLSSTSLSSRPSSSTALVAQLPNPRESQDQITVVVDSQTSKTNAPDTPAASSSTSQLFTPSQNLVLLILRLTHRLIRNSSHDTRHVYNSVEHVGALLSDNSTAIVLLALEILNMLLQRSHKYRSARITMTLELTERLIDLSFGWGGRENGLGLLECCSATQAQDLSEDGKKLFFQFTSSSDAGKDDADEAASKSPNTFGDSQGRRMFNAMSVARNILTSPLPLPPCTQSTSNSLCEIPTVKTDGKTKTIYMRDAGLFKGDERWLLTEFAQKHGVPKNKLFSFLCSFRRASRFSAGREARLEASIIRLYAITTLFQVQPLPNAVHESINREPELIQDIVSLAKSDPADGLHDVPRCLRIIAIRCITAMSSDRHRVSAIATATGVDQYHGALPTLLRSEMTSLISSSNSLGSTARESFESGTITPDRASLPHCVSSKLSPLSLLAECSRFPPFMLRIQTTEALLALVHGLALAPGSSGATPLANSGVLGILIPALTDRDPRHSRVVAQAIRTMQAIIEGSNRSVGCQLFRDQEGLALIAERIAVEVGVNPSSVSDKEQALNDEAVEVEALRRRGESRALYQKFANRQMTHSEALERQPPSSSAASRGLLSHSKWALLRGLHQLFIVSLGNGGSEVREAVANTPLPKALRKILGQPFMHGGSLFFSAASLTTDIAHAEPTATNELVNAGVAQAVLRSINVGLPPCGEAVKCIPNLLAALCLASTAREEIVSSAPLKPYLLRLATPFYTRAMHGEISIHIGSSLDELMRHVEALRPEGNRAMCEYLMRSASFVGTDSAGVARTLNNSSPSNSRPDAEVPRTDRRTKIGETSSLSSSIGGPQVEGESTHPDIVLLDKMKLAVANNSSLMAGIHQGSTEHQEGVVSSGGLDHMIGLRLAPALACPEASVRETHSFSRHYPTPAVTTTSMVTSLRNFSSRHGSVVLESLFKAVYQDAAAALQAAKELDDCWLPEEEDVCSNSASIGGLKTETEVASSETNSSSQKVKRKELRTKLEECIRKLRVEVVLLSGLSRGGPGSSSSVWESAGGSHVATIISTVERAARFHLAKVYTGLSLNSISDGDLGTARVTAAANPTLKPLRADQVTRLVGDVSKTVSSSRAKSRRFEEICKRYEVPPEDLSALRLDVKGFAWHLVTFVVAAQRLYSTLAKGLLLGSRRHSRASLRYNDNAKSLSSTIGRIFVLHFKAAAPLWNMKVVSMGGGQVVAAWDYIRGIIVEVKGTLFDEPRSSTHGLLLKSFLEAGGGEALIDSIRPSLLLRAATMNRIVPPPGISSHFRTAEELKELLEKETLSTCSLILALSDLMRENEGNVEGEINTMKGKSDDEMSSDSVSNQARAMSRMVVSDVETCKDESSLSETKLMELLRDKEYLTFVRNKTKQLWDISMDLCSDLVIQKIAADSWSTAGSFMHTLAMCSGLSNNSPSPELRRFEEWNPIDIHRTALHVVLRLLEPIATQSEDLLSVRSSDSTAVTDVLGVVQVITSSYPELCRSSSNAERDVGNMDDWEDFLEPQEETPSSRPRSPDPELVQSLVEMGFSERRARMALRRTPGGLQLAADWLLSTPEGEDISDRSDEDDRRWDGEGPNHPNGGGRDDNENEDDEEDDDDIDDDQDDEDVNDDNVLNDDEEELDDADDDEDDIPDIDNEDDDDEGIEIVSGDELNPLVETEVVNTGDVSLRELTMVDTIETDTSPVFALDASAPRREESSSAQEFQPSNGPSENSYDMAVKVSCPPSPVQPTKSIDVDGKALLHRTASVEISLLYFALDQDANVDRKVVKDLCVLAASHLGIPEAFDEDAIRNDSIRPFPATPVSVDHFKTCKKAIFENLLTLTFNIIKENSSKGIPSHVPYAAIEMLSALQKDGVVSKEHASEFASSLSAGLRLWLTSTSQERKNRNTRGQFIPLWSHHGGWQGRKLLESHGAFRIAYDFLRDIVNGWKEPCEAVAGDASEPIDNLKIRAPSEDEAAKLSQLTTCFLTLDARIRYRQKDDLIQLSQQRFEELAKEKFKKESNMEVDQASNERPTAEINGGRTSVRQEDTSPNIDDDPSILKIEEKSISDVVMASDENVFSLERENELAQKKREKLLSGTLAKVSELTESAKLRNDSSTNDNDFVLLFTMRAVRFLSRLESGDAMLAALQLLGGLTQEWYTTSLAIKDGIIYTLLKLPHLEQRRVSSVDCRVVRMLIRTILRHVIEDQETLTEAMVCEIREVASGSNRPPRSSYTMRSLIEATSPLAARDLKAYVNALYRCVSAGGTDRTSQVVVTSQKGLSRKEAEDRLENRSNVRDVIVGLCDLLAMSIGAVNLERGDAKSGAKGREARVFDLPKYALKMLAEIVEFSRVAAVALVKTTSPSKEVEGNALDYMLQKLLPLGRKVDGLVELSEAEFVKDALDVCNGVQRLFLALCSKGAGAHSEAVDAFARAVGNESRKEKSCSAVVKGVAQCLAPGTRSRVMRAVLKTNLANDLAICLSKLDVDGDAGVEVTVIVLRALSLIGEAATHLSRYGDRVNDDVSFGGRGGDTWMGFRDREDFLVI